MQKLLYLNLIQKDYYTEFLFDRFKFLEKNVSTCQDFL